MTERPRKVIATIGTGPMEPVLEVALRSFVRFAELHGYDVVVGSGASDGRPASWGKIPLLRELVGSYDVVVWLDSDIIIRDASVDLPVLPPRALLGMVEHTSPPEFGRVLNGGMLVLRGCPETVELLDEVWAQTQYARHRWWEQAAVMHLMGYPPDPLPVTPTGSTRWRERLALLPPEWNVLYAWPWPEGPRFLHLAGMSNQERRFVMQLELWRSRNGPLRHLYRPGIFWFRLSRFVRVRVLRRGRGVGAAAPAAPEPDAAHPGAGTPDPGEPRNAAT